MNPSLRTWPLATRISQFCRAPPPTYPLDGDHDSPCPARAAQHRPTSGRDPAAAPATAAADFLLDRDPVGARVLAPAPASYEVSVD